MRIELFKKWYPLFLSLNFWKWRFEWHISSIEFRDHDCMNQCMDGDYECEYCNPHKEHQP